MESLLLSGKRKGVVTLEGIKNILYDIRKPEKIGDMSLIPNGKYSNNPYDEIICEVLLSNPYCDSVILKADGSEYPIYFGAYSKDHIPRRIAYGKIQGDRIILLYDEFNINCLNYLKADLEFSAFIEGQLSYKYGKIFSINQRREIYSYLKDKREKVDLSVIGKPNLEALEESASQINNYFVLKMTY